MKEALKLALEALTNAIAVRNGEGGTKLVSPLEENAITAIKEALAQPEQEPVEDIVAYHSDGTRTVRIAPKRPWVGLTDEDYQGMSAGDHVVAFWVDRILKEKNAP